MKDIYFDHAATTYLDERVLAAMLPYFTEVYGNPSSFHMIGLQAKQAVSEARKTIAKIINAREEEIIFTSGGTESNNMAIKCAVRDLGVRHIISSPMEHHCGLHTIECVAHYDNSTRNKFNPDPTQTVRWGDQTWEEMMIGWFNYNVDAEPFKTPRVSTGGGQ
jgi:cysteine desulfurase